MKFTLTFDGELRTGAKQRRNQLLVLRQHFHRQLKRLWLVNPFLREWTIVDKGNPVLVSQWMPNFVPSANGIYFLPIVVTKLCTECALDFRILRSTVRMGNASDIDNQIKLIVDSLRMPQNGGEIGTAEDYSDFNPLYCLVQDDKGINRISSVSDEMLEHSGAVGEFDPKYCRIQIDVYIRPVLPITGNYIFFSDEAKLWDHKYDDNIPEYLGGMNNNQLKAATTQCIFRIQALSESFEGSLGAIIRDTDATTKTRRMHDMSDSAKSIWQADLWPKAFALREELLRRIYGEGPYPDSPSHSPAIKHGMLAGIHPLAGAALELETLVRRLP